MSQHRDPGPPFRSFDSVAGAGTGGVGAGGAGSDLDGWAEGLDAGDVSCFGFGRGDGELSGRYSAVGDVAG